MAQGGADAGADGGADAGAGVTSAGAGQRKGMRGGKDVNKGGVVKGGVVKGGRAKPTVVGGWRGPWPEPSPWAHLLAEYAYAARTRAHPRPLSTREIGERCGYSRQTVYGWMGQGIEPPLPIMLQVVVALGLSAEDLIRVYQEAGSSALGPPIAAAPALSAAAPAPAAAAAPPASAPQQAPQQAQREAQREAERQAQRAAERQAAAAEAEWALSLANAEASMREAGVPDAAIALTLEHMRARMAGTDARSQLPRRQAEEQGAGQMPGQPHTPASPAAPSSPAPSSPAPSSPAPQSSSR